MGNNYYTGQPDKATGIVPFDLPAYPQPTNRGYIDYTLQQKRVPQINPWLLRKTGIQKTLGLMGQPQTFAAAVPNYNLVARDTPRPAGCETQGWLQNLQVPPWFNMVDVFVVPTKLPSKNYNTPYKVFNFVKIDDSGEGG
jgi:hypothetical protein